MIMNAHYEEKIEFGNSFVEDVEVRGEKLFQNLNGSY